MNVQAQKKLTYDDYVLIPDDGLRHEIIDGEHYVNAAPNVRHQWVSARIFRALADFVESHDLGEVFYSPIDVVFEKHNVVQPDVVFIRKTHVSELIGAAFVKVTPELVVEVLSVSNRRHDEVRKLKLYDTYAVQEYWIADPEKNAVKIYRRQNGGLTLVEKVELGGMVTTPLLPGFVLATNRVFP
jgi:Uma2 family endonuclease